jgi:hypothetical protein
MPPLLSCKPSRSNPPEKVMTMTREIKYQTEGHHESELIESLEPDQLVMAVAKPLPRLRLSRPASIALWAVRIFVLIITVLVIYTFVVKLMSHR